MPLLLSWRMSTQRLPLFRMTLTIGLYADTGSRDTALITRAISCMTMTLSISWPRASFPVCTSAIAIVQAYRRRLAQPKHGEVQASEAVRKKTSQSSEQVRKTVHQRRRMLRHLVEVLMRLETVGFDCAKRAPADAATRAQSDAQGVISIHSKAAPIRTQASALAGSSDGRAVGKVVAGGPRTSARLPLRPSALLPTLLTGTSAAETYQTHRGDVLSLAEQRNKLLARAPRHTEKAMLPQQRSLAKKPRRSTIKRGRITHCCPRHRQG